MTPITSVPTILVVDDDPVVRRLHQRTLEEAGWPVLTAGEAMGAIRLLADGAQVGAVVTDLAMPGLRGRVLLELLQRDRPGLPVVVISGWVSPAERLALETTHGAVVLQKPIATLDVLVDAVRSVLREKVA